MSALAMFRAALRRLFGRWRRNATDAELEAAMLRAARAAIKRHYEMGQQADGSTFRAPITKVWDALDVPDHVRNPSDAELRAAREAIKRHYETGPYPPLWHDIMAVGLPKGHTVSDPALNVDKPLERVDRLPCFGGPLDGELLTDVEFYADGSFVGAVRTDADVRGGVYAWCRQSNRAVWTQDR